MEPVHSIEDLISRERRLSLVGVLDALTEAVIIVAPDTRVQFANRAARLAIGGAQDARLEGEACTSALRDWLLSDESGNELDGEQLLRGELAGTNAIRAVQRRSGELRWWRPDSRPLRDTAGKEVARLVTLDDVTAVKEAEMRTRVLAESGRALVASLDYEQTLANVALMAVPTLADWCAVYLADEQLNIRRIVAAHRSNRKQALADRLRELQGEQVQPESPLAQVIRTGGSHLFQEVSDEALVRRAQSEEELELMRALALRSLVMVPMRVPNRTIGAMVLATDDESLRRLTTEDQELAEQLGRRAAVAIENARLYRQLSDVAETLARSFLPSELPDVPGWEVASLYRPMLSDMRIDVGGDFVELLAVGSRWFAVIGDIEGKGVLAATISALMRHGTRLAAQQRPEPGSMLAQLDQALRSHPSEVTSTILCARLGRANLVIASAGHPPPLVATAEGRTRELDIAGPLLGAFGDASWRQQRFAIRMEELVLLYTDGITEALGGRKGLGGDRLRHFLADQAGHRPSEVVEALNRALAGRDVRDDLAALVLRRR